MDLLSGIILGAVILWFVLSLVFMKKNKGGSCDGCSGDCSQCSMGSNEKKQKNKDQK